MSSLKQTCCTGLHEMVRRSLWVFTTSVCLSIIDRVPWDQRRVRVLGYPGASLPAAAQALRRLHLRPRQPGDHQPGRSDAEVRPRLPVFHQICLRLSPHRTFDSGANLSFRWKPQTGLRLHNPVTGGVEEVGQGRRSLAFIENLRIHDSFRSVFFKKNHQ